MQKLQLPLRLVAFDLDGTTIDSITRTMSPRVQHALEAAHDAGAATCVVSGRPYHMLGDDLLCAPWLDWCCGLNGSIIINAHSKEARIKQPLSPTLCLELFDQLSELHPSWGYFGEDISLHDTLGLSYLAGTLGPGGKELTVDSMRKIMSDVTFVEDVPQALQKRWYDALKLEATFKDETTAHTAYKLLCERGDVEIYPMSSTDFELNAQGVGKGSAILALCRALDIPASSVVAFGDGANDISMAGGEPTFVAMDNAIPKVKAVADEICPSLAEDGVAVWLEAHL